MSNILSKEFRYTPSAQTDLRKTFARIRREREKQAQEEAAAAAEAQLKIAPLNRKRSG